MKIKTLNQWKESKQYLTRFLSVGDVVDSDIIDYALNVLPPLTWKEDMIQISEAMDIQDGHNTYITFSRNHTSWEYSGCCHRGKRVEPKRTEIEWRY